MGTAFSGAIGEGASDVLAFLINNNPVVGEYFARVRVYVPPMRRYPYDKYPLTYANVTGAKARGQGLRANVFM
jgi:extracellular elastinolytic metalloproteinase